VSGTLQFVNGLVFREPWALLGLALLPLLILGWWWRRGAAPALLFGPSALLREGGVTSRRRSAVLRALPRALQLLGILAAVVALARPAEPLLLPRQNRGVEILLGFDVSSSMGRNLSAAGQSRLEVARSAAKKFIAGRPDDRIGLLAFARYPDLLCPPTRDHEALGRFLDDLKPREADDAEDATGMGAALARALKSFGPLEEGAGSRVVILLGDGEENVASEQTPEEIAPLHAAQYAREQGVRTHVISVDTGEDLGDRSRLQTLATRTGGRFFRAAEAADLPRIYALIDELETLPQEEPRYRFEDRFVVFLLGGVLLWLSGRALEEFGGGTLP
jgi:Ca-activated chloride channel homolog